MSLPADGVNANTLAETTTIPTGKKLIFLDPDTNEGGIITLENLTKQILSNLTSQTFNLDQGNKTLLAALNELNSKSFSVKKVSSSEAVSLLDDIKSNCILSNNDNEKSFIAISLFNSWYGYQIMFSGESGNIRFRTYWGGRRFSDWNTLPI